MDGRQALRGYIAAATSQAQFARDVKCSEGHLSLILAGKRNASIPLANRIGLAAGIPPRTLISEKLVAAVDEFEAVG